MVDTNGATRVAGGVVVVRAVALAINLAGAVALARALGPDLRGAQALFTTGSFTLALLLTVGASTGGYLLVTRGGGEPARIGVTALAHGLTAGLITLGVALIVRPAPGVLSAVPGWPAPLALAVAGLVVNSHHILLALAQGRGLLGAALSVTPYVTAAIAYVVIAISGFLTLTTAVWSFATSAMVAVVAAAWPRIRLQVIALAWPSASTALAMARAGIGGALTDLVTLLHQRIDLFLLGVLAPLASTGAYVVAYQSAEPLWALLSAGAVAAFAAAPAPADRQSTGDSTAPLIRQTVLLAGFLVLAGSVVLPQAVPLVYGEAYEAATLPLLLLLPGIAAYAVGRVASTYLVRNARLGRNARVTAVAFAGNVVMNLALIPRLGAVGAALASLCSYILYAALALTAYVQASGTRWSQLLPGRTDLAAAFTLIRVRWRSRRRYGHVGRYR